MSGRAVMIDSHAQKCSASSRYYLVRNGGQFEGKVLCYVLGRLAISGKLQLGHTYVTLPL